MRILPRLLACALRILWSLTNLTTKVDTIMASVSDLKGKLGVLFSSLDNVAHKVADLEAAVLANVATQGDIDEMAATVDAIQAQADAILAPPPAPSDDSAV